MRDTQIDITTMLELMDYYILKNPNKAHLVLSHMRKLEEHKKNLEWKYKGDTNEPYTRD